MAGQPPADDRTEEQLRAQLSALVSRLEREADRRVGQRKDIEDRWVEDLRQYHGQYDGATMRDLKAEQRSSLFINHTRPKTDTLEARLFDMLFPTDDQNWAIQPTPVPTLAEAASKSIDGAAAADQANAALEQGDMAGAEQIAQQANATVQTASAAQAVMDEAQERAKRMEAEIADQLKECRHNAVSRDVIRDACVLGTGVMKGPVVGARRRMQWRAATDPATGQTVHVMEHRDDPRPMFYRVDPWAFFPDMAARNMDENESVFERHLMTAKELRAMARQPGFIEDSIRRVLQGGARKNSPSYLTDLRAIAGAAQVDETDRYTVWEYHGPLTAEDMRELCSCLGRDDIKQDYAEADPLVEVPVVIWFAQGEVLKFGEHPYDRGESIYSVFNLQSDDATLFGYGIPFMMRDAQAVLNGAWRMMMDNAGLALGPQVEIDPSVGEPLDGTYRLLPRKIWLRKESAELNRPLLRVYNIDSRQQELAGIIQLARQFIDDETGLSQIAQGEQGSHTTQTAQGMSILMNSANINFRRIVKNWDDAITVPTITRLYDWNMQHNPRDEVKGDFDVDARGSSALLVREMQAQNLMTLANLTGHPVLGGLLKAAPLLRKTAEVMMLSGDSIVKTDDEIKIEQAAAAQQAQEAPPDPAAQFEMQKLAQQRELAEFEAQSKMALAQVHHQTAMIQLAESKNMQIEELNSKLRIKDIETQSKERILAAEVAVDARKPAGAGTAGGYV